MSNKLFSKHTMLLTAVCLALNVALVWLTKALSIPLYLDSIGTVIAAALGGTLPGIAVGFLSNCITAFTAVTPDAMTLYYGFLNVLIAVVAAWMSRAGRLRAFSGRLAAVASFAAIGGGLGSVVTWVLYGFSFGQGVSAPLARLLYAELHLSEFAAQFSADMAIDVIDKAITVLVMYAVLRALPSAVLDRLPLGHIYSDKTRWRRPAAEQEKKTARPRGRRAYRRHSIRTKITLLIVVSTTILSIIALIIGCVGYKTRLIEQYSDMCADAAAMMLPKIDGDSIDEYLELGETAPGYAQTEAALYDILNNADKIKYMYVYSIRADGCHVVFDLDTEGLEGEEPGTVVAFDESFPYVEQTIAGESIPPVITDDTYGWLLTVYEPVRDSGAAVVAYAAADIDMQDIETDLYSFCISIASLLFGVMVLITAFTLWYSEKKLLAPLGVLVKQARGMGDTKDGETLRDDPVVKTGDEIEEVFDVMCRTEDSITAHIAQLEEKNIEISHMQRNIIHTLANMVENRDENTGGHIKRTAAYVELIAKKLRAAGFCKMELTDDFIKKLYDSAPLHDIGKVKISDAILNKPGRLTPEEFELMKTHTTEGANILRTSLSEIADDSWLSVAVVMAEYHHERWDGGGYPEGLSGEAIPLCARIMAVSDVFDALISVRSYKRAYSFEESVRILKEGAGTQFDGRIVAVFADCENEIREITERY